MRVNAQYNTAHPHSLAAKIAGYQRRKMFEAFLEIGIQPTDTILDVGATSDRSYDHSNYLEAWYPYKASITALGVDEGAASLRRNYPGVRYVTGDGRALPFTDASFDYVHSSAVLEHVGDALRQTAFIAEARRVARKGVFLTTPNRWFPFEFHTVLPLIHWLPKRTFRWILSLIGHDFFASEENLNLLSGRELHRMASPLRSFGTLQIKRVHLAGLATNLLLCWRANPQR